MYQKWSRQQRIGITFIALTAKEEFRSLIGESRSMSMIYCNVTTVGLRKWKSAERWLSSMI
jgi:hypothetical protein